MAAIYLVMVAGNALRMAAHNTPPTQERERERMRCRNDVVNWKKLYHIFFINACNSIFHNRVQATRLECCLGHAHLAVDVSLSRVCFFASNPSPSQIQQKESGEKKMASSVSTSLTSQVLAQQAERKQKIQQHAKVSFSDFLFSLFAFSLHSLYSSGSNIFCMLAR